MPQRLWKLLSLGSNKPGKQTVHRLKCHLEKCHKDIYTLYMRKVESRQPAKKAKLDEVLAAHCRADLVTQRMKRTKTLDIIRWLSFSFFGRKWMSIYVFVSFSAVNGISFSSAFSFTAENEKYFGWPIVYIANGLGLGLGLEMQSLGLVLENSLDYISGRMEVVTTH